MSKVIKATKTEEVNEYEYDVEIVHENDVGQHFDRIHVVDFDMENEHTGDSFPNERVYMEDLCQRISGLLLHRWLTIDQIYNAFNCYDSRTAISIALGKLDKNNKMLFWNNTFSLKTRN